MLKGISPNNQQFHDNETPKIIRAQQQGLIACLTQLEISISGDAKLINKDFTR